MTRRSRRLAGATALLALAGAAIAAYLSYTRATDTSIMCPTSGCGVVARSSYSELAGVPVAYLGVVGYASIVATVPWRRVNGLLVLVAGAMSAYLLVAQLLPIGAVCTWCATSDGIAAALLVLAFLRRRDAVRAGRGRAGGREATLASDAPLSRHDVRLPDERPRQRADQGSARGSRPRRGAVPRRRGRRRLQHVHDP